MAEAEGASKEPRVVALIIKNPSAVTVGDFRMEMPVEATVLAVKQRLQRDYTGHPELARQKLIVGGQIIKDGAPIREVFKLNNLAEPQVMHLVVAKPPSESAPSLNSSIPSQATLASLPSSATPAASPSTASSSGANAPIQRRIAPFSGAVDASAGSDTSSSAGRAPFVFTAGTDSGSNRRQGVPAAGPSLYGNPPSSSAYSPAGEPMGQSNSTSIGGAGPSSSASPATDGNVAAAGAAAASGGSPMQPGIDATAFPAGPLPPETVNLAMLQMMYGGMMLHPWAYSPAMAAYNAALLNPAAFGGLGPHYPGFMPPMCPPGTFPAYMPLPGDQQQRQQPGGVFAMAPLQGGAMGAAGFGAMPFNMPLGGPLQAMPPGMAGGGPMGPPLAMRVGAGGAQPPGPGGLRQRQGPAVGAAIAVQGGGGGPQAVFVQHVGREGRPFARRIRIQLRLDLMLIAKLAVLVFAFNQGGAFHRFLLLSTAAVLFYLYQTGALAPLVRWFSRGTRQMLGRPLHPPAPPEPMNPGQENREGAEGGAGPALDGVAAAAAEQQPRAQQRDRWGVLRELQVFIMGFVVSLLPGFNPPDEPLFREAEGGPQAPANANLPHQD